MTTADRSIKASPGQLADDRNSTEAFRDKNGRIYQGWLTTFASMVGLTLGPGALLVFCFGLFVKPLQNEFGWGIAAISFGGTILAICNVIATVMAGALSDRIGTRRIVLWSLPFFAAAVAGFSLLPRDITVFYLMLSVAALLGMGGWSVIYNKATAGWFDRRLGLSLGFANAGFGIGAAVLPLLVGHLIPAYGWRSTYVVLGVLALVPWVICYFMLKDRGTPSVSGEHAAKVFSGLLLRESMRTSEFWLILVGFVTLGIASVSVLVHFVPIFVDTGLTQAQAGALQAMLGVSVIFARVLTGWLLDRVSAPLLMAGLCIIGAGAFVVIAVGAPYGLGPVCAIVIGFVIGAEFDVLGYLVPRYFGRRAFGAIYGVNYAFFQIAGSVTIALLGISRGASGSYSTGLIAIGAILAAGGLCFAFLGQPRFTPSSSKSPVVSDEKEGSAAVSTK